MFFMFQVDEWLFPGVINTGNSERIKAYLQMGGMGGGRNSYPTTKNSIYISTLG